MYIVLTITDHSIIISRMKKDITINKLKLKLKSRYLKKWYLSRYLSHTLNITTNRISCNYFTNSCTIHAFLILFKFFSLIPFSWIHRIDRCWLLSDWLLTFNIFWLESVAKWNDLTERFWNARHASTSESKQKKKKTIPITRKIFCG